MSTRRGEPIEAEQQTVADILRPLAEAVVGCNCHQMKPEHACLHSEGRIPDPRFEALRQGPSPMFQGIVGPPLSTMLWGIDASLGAIHSASQAMGYMVMLLTSNEGHADCSFFRTPYDLGAWMRGETASQGYGEGVTSEEAAARALVAAWSDESLHSITAPMQDNR